MGSHEAFELAPLKYCYDYIAIIVIIVVNTIIGYHLIIGNVN